MTPTPFRVVASPFALIPFAFSEAGQQPTKNPVVRQFLLLTVSPVPIRWTVGPLRSFDDDRCLRFTILLPFAQAENGGSAD